jgi:hypothetical protein
MTKVWEVQAYTGFIHSLGLYSTEAKAKEAMGSFIQSTYDWGWIKDPNRDAFTAGNNDIEIIEHEVL